MSGDVVDRAALEHLLTEGIKDYLSESCRTRIVNVILNAGFQRASLARQTDGLAWLIERGQAENQRPTLYWTGTTDHADQKYDGIWTEDVNGAHKYASKQAAQTALDASYLAALGRDAAGAHVAEHLWMAGDPLPRQTIEGEPVYLDAWPLRDAVRRLVEAADHLFDVHDGDHHGYEELICARDAAKEWLSANHPEVAQRTIEGAMLAVKQAGIEAAVVVLQESLDDREWLRALVHSQAATITALQAEKMLVPSGLQIKFTRALPVGCLYSHPDTIKGPDAQKMVDDFNAAKSATTIQALPSSPVPRAGESANDGL